MGRHGRASQASRLPQVPEQHSTPGHGHEHGPAVPAGHRVRVLLVALVVSLGVLVAFVLPAILDGRNPLAVAVVGACLIMFAVLYLSHGLSARTSTAVLGTLVSLGLIGVAALVASQEDVS